MIRILIKFPVFFPLKSATAVLITARLNSAVLAAMWICGKKKRMGAPCPIDGRIGGAKMVIHNQTTSGLLWLGKQVGMTARVVSKLIHLRARKILKHEIWVGH